MTLTETMTAERRAEIVPSAAHQAESAAVLHSANAGVVVQKVGQLRSEFRNEGRMFAREMAKHVNNRQGGRAAAYVYEETFGYEDRIHFLIHLRSPDTYYHMVEMGDQDRAYRDSVAKQRVQEPAGAGAFDRLFVDGTLRSIVLLPQPWDGPAGPVPVAGSQTDQPQDQLLHSANAGIVLMRTADIAYGHRGRANRFAANLAEGINKDFVGAATVLRYDEAFGAADRLHLIFHLKDLITYRRLLEHDALTQEIPEGAFVPGSIRDIALTPHHWGLYATRVQASG